MGCARASVCVDVLIKLLAASMCLKHFPVVYVSVCCGQRERCVLAHAAAAQQRRGTLEAANPASPEGMAVSHVRLSQVLCCCGNVLSFCSSLDDQ